MYDLLNEVSFVELRIFVDSRSNRDDRDYQCKDDAVEFENT